MSDIDLKRTVGDIVTERPARSRVFEDLGIDYCCGGQRPLAEAIEEKGVKPETVIEKLIAIDQNGTPSETVDYGSLSLTDLVNHITENHHTYVKSELPRINELVNKVADAHSDSPKANDLHELVGVVKSLTGELQSHLMKEEQVLFPAILRAENENLTPDAVSGMEHPMKVMEAEHDTAGDALARIYKLTDGHTSPEWACNTYRAMIDALATFEKDLHQHIHKENNVLFPKVRALTD